MKKMHSLPGDGRSFHLLIWLCALALSIFLFHFPAIKAYPQTPQSGLAFIASNSKKYMAEGNNLFVLDISRAVNESLKAVVSVIPVRSQRFAFSHDGSLCLSGNDLDNEAVLIDATRAVTSPAASIITRIPLSAPPSHIEISKGRPLAFIVENSLKMVEILDLEHAAGAPENCLITRLYFEHPVQSISLSPDNKYLLVIDEKVCIMDISRIISANGSAEISQCVCRFAPSYALFDGKMNFLYVSDISGIVLTILGCSTAQGRPVLMELCEGRARILPEDRPSFKTDNLHNLTLMTDSRHLIMVHPDLNRISVIDTTSATKGESSWGKSELSTGQGPRQACVTGDGNLVLVNNLLSGNIYVFDAGKCINAPAEALISKIAVPAPCFMGIMP